MTAESEIVEALLHQGKTTILEARAFLSAVILRETERLKRQRMVTAMDMGPGRPEDDDRHDWAQKAAWGHLARQGIRVTVDAKLETDLKNKGLSDQRIHSLRLAIHPRLCPPIVNTTALRMSAIYAQTARRPQRRSAHCADEHCP